MGHEKRHEYLFIRVFKNFLAPAAAKVMNNAATPPFEISSLSERRLRTL